MAEAKFKLTFGFADASTRDVEVGPFLPSASAIANVKTNINTVNTNISDIASLYLSDSGANCTGITAAQVIVTNETEINLNDAVEEEET